MRRPGLRGAAMARDSYGVQPTYRGKPVEITEAEAGYGYNPDDDAAWAQAIYTLEGMYIAGDRDGGQMIDLKTARKLAEELAGIMGIEAPPMEFRNLSREDGFVKIDQNTTLKYGGGMTSGNIYMRGHEMWVDDVGVIMASYKQKVRKYAILHEMTHVLLYRHNMPWCGHGPEFLARLMPIYAKYLGWDLDSLIDCARDDFGLHLDRGQALEFARAIGCPANDNMAPADGMSYGMAG
jgi:hypothetical protein